MLAAAYCRYCHSLRAVRVVEAGVVDGDPHAAQPCVALDRADPERRVPHPQPGVPALVGVGARAAPVLLEEHPQPHLRGPEVLLRVERPQHLVPGDLLVEAGDDLVEDRRAAHLGVEVLGIAHGAIIPAPAGDRVRVRAGRTVGSPAAAADIASTGRGTPRVVERVGDRRVERALHGELPARAAPRTVSRSVTLLRGDGSTPSISGASSTSSAMSRLRPPAPRRPGRASSVASAMSALCATGQVHHRDGEALALVAHAQDLAVAHVPDGAVDVAQRRDAQPDGLDRAAGLADVDDVADPVLVLQQHEHAGQEVVHEVLRAEADRDADDARRGQDRRQVDAELGQHHDRGR